AVAGVVAVFVFALMASFGLPIDTRYAFLPGAILCVFCGAGVFGWSALPKGDRRRAPWMGVGVVVLVALLATLPGQVGSAHKELSKLARQESMQGDRPGVRARGSAQPRPNPPARALPRRTPWPDRERRSEADRRRHLRGPGK